MAIDQTKIKRFTFVHIHQDVGIKATREFEEMLRTTRSEGKCSFSQVQKSLKVGNGYREEEKPNVNPYDIKFHRLCKVKKVSVF